MTALIDVVFLLLLFFMLTSTFSSFGEIELNRAGGAQAEAEQPVQRAFVQLGADQLSLNGTSVELTTIAEQIDEGLVLVSLQGDVTSQRLVDLLAALRGRPDLTVLVLE
ncbi:biopolymer transporter ExbD [Lutimaribacter marinistellae]|uniref:Biopolymer transporter ExbD n=1 Tax=Lutimaribacter marinistellae TaxID=1820329 RepID=A0ABV7T9Y4_9RHOB